MTSVSVLFESRKLHKLIAVFLAVVLITGIMPLTAKASSVSVWVEGASKPGNHEKGSGFGIRGTVKSSATNITDIVAGVYYQSDSTKAAIQKVVNFSTSKKSYDLSGTINDNLSFGKLDVGNYIYRVAVLAGGETEFVINHKFSVVASSSSVTKVSISGENTPATKHVKGNNFGIRGEITSNKAITDVVAGVYYQSNSTKAVMQKVVNLSGSVTKYDLSGTINDSLSFGNLSEGEYTYRVGVLSGGQTHIVIDDDFSVVAPDISITGATKPTSKHMRGDNFAIRGTVKANCTLSSVTGGIYYADGTPTKYVKTVKPGDSEYELKGAINDALAFGSLPLGNYVYRVTATANGYTEHLIGVSFEVVKEEVSINIAYPNLPTTTFAQGKSFLLGGIITSNYTITSLTAGIYKPSGDEALAPKTVKPNTVSYNLADIKDSLAVQNLSGGIYTYKVVATTDGRNFQLVEHTFTIVAPKSESLEMSISYVNDPGFQHKVGTDFNPGGVITSNYSISSVTLRVYNNSKNGITAIEKTVYPNKTTYNLADISDFGFNTLSLGNYTYRVYAVSSGTSKQMHEFTFDVINPVNPPPAPVLDYGHGFVTVNGRKIPVYLPEFSADGSNISIHQNEWGNLDDETFCELFRITDTAKVWIDVLNGGMEDDGLCVTISLNDAIRLNGNNKDVSEVYSNQSGILALGSVISGILSAYNNNTQTYMLKVIVQKRYDQYRAIVQVESSQWALHQYGGDTYATIPGEGEFAKRYDLDRKRCVRNLVNKLEADGYGAYIVEDEEMNIYVTSDEGHINDEAIGYITFDDGRLLLTPKFYPNDRVKICYDTWDLGFIFRIGKQVEVHDMTSDMRVTCVLSDYDVRMDKKILDGTVEFSSY